MRSEVRFPECLSCSFFGVRVPFFFHLFFLGSACGFATGYLDLIDYKYTVGCCTTCECVFVYNCHAFLLLLLLCVLLYCCCCRCSAAACCCSPSCAGWHNFVLWFIASDSSVFLLFIQTRFIFIAPLGSTVACHEIPIVHTIHIIHPL